MIRIAITVEAYEAIVATLPMGSVAYEPEPNAKGERLIWVEEIWCSKAQRHAQPRRELQVTSSCYSSSRRGASRWDARGANRCDRRGDARGPARPRRRARVRTAISGAQACPQCRRAHGRDRGEAPRRAFGALRLRHYEAAPIGGGGALGRGFEG